MCCWFSVSYASWAELLRILEHERIWHANRGNLRTTKLLLLFSTDLITPSPVFKISLSLLRSDRLQHLKILFLIQLSLSRHWCSAQHRFLSWHPRWRVPESHVGSWATASHSVPVGANPTLQPSGKGKCAIWMGREVIPTESERTLSSCSILRALSVWERYLIR